MRPPSRRSRAHVNMTSRARTGDRSRGSDADARIAIAEYGYYDEEIIENLQKIGNYYGYKPGVGSLLASATR